ncbi:MAG: acyl-CoA thioesterase [Desulfobacteraceae bacterium]|nr:acyl-CoA thioesterase [Desulfobacteraceae bacterium]
MRTHKTTYRVIYGDTDNMGVVYNANYLRFFEIGRTEMFRALGLTYKAIEEKGVMLPVSEVKCKYIQPATYDDLLVIETGLDTRVRGGVKFDYRIFNEDEKRLLAKGHTLHACLNPEGRVIRPPRFLSELIREKNLTNEV